MFALVRRDLARSLLGRGVRVLGRRRRGEGGDDQRERDENGTDLPHDGDRLPDVAI